MSWSKPQQLLAVKAATLAGWNDAQRYMAMRHAGCPITSTGRSGGLSKASPSGASKPSVKHPGNNQDHYELYMAIAESAARQAGKGHLFPAPANAESWGELARRRLTRTVHAIERIAGEAMSRLPDVFLPNFLTGFVQRMTMNDCQQFCGASPVPLTLAECDEAQLYRIHEGLKAWAGREFLARDQRPGTFTIPASVYAQLRARAAGGPRATASVLAGRDEDQPTT
jgi:hypothetical protein